MSRTYRKNARWIEKYQGEFYSSWLDKTRNSIKFPFDIKKGSLWDLPIGTARFRVAVWVGDRDNFRKFKGYSRDIKNICHRTDRARFKQALLKNEDAYIKPSFDPWDWD